MSAQVAPSDGHQPSAQAMIRPARELAGITLRELARRICVSVGTMSAIETGKTPVSAERLERIAAELDTTVDRLASANPTPGPPAEAPPFDWRNYAPRELDPVLSAAIRSFVRTGYHGATMRTIAAEAGISVPGVYHHYPSKQALLVAAFELAIAEVDIHLQAARDEAFDPVARLGQICEALVLFATMRRDLARIVVAEARSVEPPNDAHVEAFTRQLIDAIADEIAAGVAAGQLSTDDAAEAARAVLGLCLGVSQWFTESRHAPADVAHQYSRYALNVVCAR